MRPMTGVVRLVVLLGVFVGWAGGGRAQAEPEPPREPIWRLTGVASPPAGPSSTSAVLTPNEFANPGTGAIPSQNFEASYDRFDNRAADDFHISTESETISSWVISAVRVGGSYGAGIAGSEASVASVNVRFYVDSVGRPGTSVYSQTLSTSGDTSSGTLLIPLPSPLRLAAGATYWVSVQANKDYYTTGQWFWTERTVQTHSRSVWQNPGNVTGANCLSWRPTQDCLQGTAPDLLFELQGNTSNSNAPPILTNLRPGAVANQDFVLTVEGANFASGATLNWTVGAGAPKSFPATVLSSSQLTVNIPAADVSAYGAQVTVTVTNPTPCEGSCTSDSLPFIVENRVYLSFIRR